MTVQTKPVTAEELLNMPDDGLRRELVRGELREMVPAGNRHGYVAGEMFGELRNHVKANGLGLTYAAETGFKLSSNPDTVRAPDAAFVSQARLDNVGDVPGYWPGAPDLVVEVVSPNDRHTEVMDKALIWLEAGCLMVLVADPGRCTVTVYRSREDIRVLTAEAGDVVDGADVVPGWKLALAEIFVQE
jgi:Uma2 family endonuclease